MPGDARIIAISDVDVRFVTVRGNGLQPDQVFDARLFVGAGPSIHQKGVADAQGRFVVHFPVNNSTPINPLTLSGYVRATTVRLDFGAGALS